MPVRLVAANSGMTYMDTTDMAMSNTAMAVMVRAISGTLTVQSALSARPKVMTSLAESRSLLQRREIQAIRSRS